MCDRPRLSLQVARCAQQIDDRGLGLLRSFASEHCVVCARSIRHNRSGRLGDDAPIAADDGAGRQVEFAPPHHVGEVTERADHGDARAFVGLRKWVRIHADFHIKQR